MEAMSETLANAFVYLLAAYAGLGFVFAVIFVWRGIGRLDAGAQGTGVFFRLLVLPGVAAFWPMFLSRWVQGIAEAPVEKNPHR
jgi:hypothetical protein